MLAAALGEVPALPLHTAGKYVAGAYVVLFLIVLIYVAIMALRLSRIERDLGELLSMSASSPEGERPAETAAAAEHPDEYTPAGGAGRQDPQRESTPAYPVEGHM
jgi:hypothetical protein